MKSVEHDNNRSSVEVTHISKHGIWLLSTNNELFIRFNEFPRFRDASVANIFNVERPTPNMLHWPQLGITLAFESLRCFPLVSSPSHAPTRSGKRAKAIPHTHSKLTVRTISIKATAHAQRMTVPKTPHVHNPASPDTGDAGDTSRGKD